MAKTYRAAIIGRTNRGNYGHGIDEVWRHVPRVELVAVADDDKAGLAATARRLSIERTYTDYRRMLDEVKPDVVGICPRWIDQHHAMALACAERGIHMFMEKPFCRTLAEADEIVTACERSHVKLQLAVSTRFSPKIAVIQQMIAEGALGKVLEFRGRGKEDQRGGGEDLWVLGTHILDLTRLFGGDPAWCFASVMQGGRPAQGSDVVDGPEGIGPLTGDAVHAMYGLPQGATAYFASIRNGGRGARFALRIFGTDGVLELQTNYLPSVKYLPDPSWSPARSDSRWIDVSSAGPGKEEPLDDGGHASANRAAVEDLLDSIEQDRQPMASVYDARAVTEMVVAVFASHVQGGQVELPLADRKNPLISLA